MPDKPSVLKDVHKQFFPKVQFGRDLWKNGQHTIQVGSRAGRDKSYSRSSDRTVDDEVKLWFYGFIRLQKGSKPHFYQKKLQESVQAKRLIKSASSI